MCWEDFWRSCAEQKSALVSIINGYFHRKEDEQTLHFLEAIFLKIMWKVERQGNRALLSISKCQQARGQSQSQETKLRSLQWVSGTQWLAASWVCISRKPESDAEPGLASRHWDSYAGTSSSLLIAAPNANLEIQTWCWRFPAHSLLVVQSDVSWMISYTLLASLKISGFTLRAQSIHLACRCVFSDLYSVHPKRTLQTWLDCHQLKLRVSHKILLSSFVERQIRNCGCAWVTFQYGSN